MKVMIKKSYTAVLLSVLALAACEKVSLSEKENSGIDLVFTISGDAADTKSIVSNDREGGKNKLNYQWSESDKMTIIPDVGSAVTATVTPDPSNPKSKSATIRAKLKDDAKGATKIKVVYPAIEDKKEAATIDFSVQDGTLASLSKFAQLYGTANISIKDGAATVWTNSYPERNIISLTLPSGKINGKMMNSYQYVYVASSIYGLKVKDQNGNPVKVKKAYIFNKAYVDDNTKVPFYTDYTVDYIAEGETWPCNSIKANIGYGIEINLKDATEDRFYVAIPGYGDNSKKNYTRNSAEVEFFFIDENYITYKATKKIIEQAVDKEVCYYPADLVAEKQTGPADLGLSVKWARQDVGADGPTKIGSKITQSEALNAESTLGSGWRLPTTNEMKELINNCTWIPSNDFGAGLIVRSKKTGDSIFLPKHSQSSNPSSCVYWIRDGSSYAAMFHANSSEIDFYSKDSELYKKTSYTFSARAVYSGK